jgi:hypothetical protein
MMIRVGKHEGVDAVRVIATVSMLRTFHKIGRTGI